MTVSHTYLFFATLWVLKSTYQVLYKLPLYCDLSHVFLMIKLRLWVWGKKTTEVKYHFHHIIFKGACYQFDSSLLVLTLMHLAKVVFVRFPHCQVPFFPLSMLCSLEGGHYVQPHLRSGELYLTSLKVLFLPKLPESLLHRRFVSSLLVCLISVSMNSWIFILYCGLQSNTTLFCSNCFSFSYWELFHLAPVSLLGCCFWALLTFWHYKMLQVHLIYFWPQSWDQPFLQEDFPFIEEWY